MSSTGLNVTYNTLYINETLNFCGCKTLSEVAFVFFFNLPSILTLVNGTVLSIPACKIYKTTSTSTFDYVVSLSDLEVVWVGIVVA